MYILLWELGGFERPKRYIRKLIWLLEAGASGRAKRGLLHARETPLPHLTDYNYLAMRLRKATGKYISEPGKHSSVRLRPTAMFAYLVAVQC